MRYDVDLLKKVETKPINEKAIVVDRMNDSFLASRLSDYQNIKYDELITVLYNNPFIHSTKNNNIKIKYLDDYCIKYQNKPLSIGGLILSNEFKTREKKKLLKKYFNKNIEEYNKDLNDKILQMDNLINIADNFNPKRIKLITIIICLLVTLICYLVHFPSDNLLDINIIGPFLQRFINKVNRTPILIWCKYISLIICFLTSFYLLFYSISLFFLTRKYDSTFDRIEDLSQDLKKKTKKSFKKILKHYNKQLKIKDINKYKVFKTEDIIDKKYHLCNIDNLNRKSLNKLSTIKTTVNYLFKLRILFYILDIIGFITYVVLLLI